MASGKEKKSSKLLLTPVCIVREKELLLVNKCIDHLGQFGLTLWVVSMNQMPKNCDLLNLISTWHARQKKILNTFACHNSWTYMVDFNLYMKKNIIIVHPRISIFISSFVVVCPRISFHSASTPMSTTTLFSIYSQTDLCQIHVEQNQSIICVSY